MLQDRKLQVAVVAVEPCLSVVACLAAGGPFLAAFAGGPSLAAFAGGPSLVAFAEEPFLVVFAEEPFLAAFAEEPFLAVVEPYLAVAAPFAAVQRGQTLLVIESLGLFGTLQLGLGPSEQVRTTQQCVFG